MEVQSRTPSCRLWSQGWSRLDAGEAVPARGQHCRRRCGRASGGGTVYVGSRRKASAAAVAELPAAPVLPRVGLGFVGWDVWRRGEPRTASRGPHPLFIALCDGGPPTMGWLGAPDQGARTSLLRPLGRNGREIELTYSWSFPKSEGSTRQKRHHTWFFIEDHHAQDQTDRSGNILPGKINSLWLNWSWF
jgi:hypothetical protein